MDKIIMLICLTFLFSSCASMKEHKHARGSIVALDSKTEAHVCMDSSEVKEGEKLSLFESVCVTKQKRMGKNGEAMDYTTCEKVSRGVAEVVKASDPHFIKIKALDNATFQEGFVVEK